MQVGEYVKCLVSASRPNKGSHLNLTLFSCAAMSDCCSSVQLLCDHGASVNAKDLVRISAIPFFYSIAVLAPLYSVLHVSEGFVS